MAGILRAFAYFSSSSVIGSLTQVAKGKIAALLLGTAGLGIFNQLTTCFSLLHTIGGLGFYNGVVRHSAARIHDRDDEGFRQHISVNLFFLVSVSILVAGIAVTFSELISDYIFADGGNRSELVVLVSLGVPVAVAGQVYRAALNAGRHVRRIVVVRVAADVISVVLFWWLTDAFSVAGAVAGFLAMHGLFLIFSSLAVRREFGPILVMPRSRSSAQREISQNCNFGFAGLFNTSIGLLSNILIARMVIDQLGVESNGIVAVAIKVTTVYLGGLNAATGGYYYPQLVVAATEGRMEFEMNRTLELYFYFLPPVVATLMVGGKLLISVIFSADFAGASPLLLFLLPGDLFRTIRETLGMSFLVTGRIGTAVCCRSFQCVAYLIFSFVLLPVFGIVGVGVSYFGANCLAAVAVMLLVRRQSGYRISQTCRSAIIRGFGLVAASFVVVSLDLQVGIKWGATMLFLCVWVGFSLQAPEFSRIAKKTWAQLQQ